MCCRANTRIDFANSQAATVATPRGVVTMKRFLKFLPVVLVAGFVSAGSLSPATAGEGDKWLGSPAPSRPANQGLMVRLRGLAVVPDEDASNVTLDRVGIAADLNIDNSVVPELDLTWFFTPNFAAELILAVTPHDIDGTGVLAGSIGDAWLLPPTLLAQYHFNNGGRFKPYVGAGVNYTVFFNKDDSGAFLPNAGLTVSNLDLEDSFGLALQGGVDIHLRDNMYLNLDVKKLFLDTEATVRTVQGGAGANVVRADVDIDPWIFGIGIGWKLGGS